jgi:hypothetical protein
MEITILILSHQVDADGSAFAHGVGEQWGAEVRWEAWLGVDDSQWSIRIPGGLEQGDMAGVDGDAILHEVRARLQTLPRHEKEPPILSPR